MWAVCPSVKVRCHMAKARCHLAKTRFCEVKVYVTWLNNDITSSNSESARLNIMFGVRINLKCSKRNIIWRLVYDQTASDYIRITFHLKIFNNFITESLIFYLLKKIISRLSHYIIDLRQDIFGSQIVSLT